MPLCFLKNVGGKLGKAAQELSGIVGTLNLSQRAFLSLMSRNACNGENGETGEKSPATGDLNWRPKVAPWRLAILAKMAILAILAKTAMYAMAKMAKLAKNHQPLAI